MIAASNNFAIASPKLYSSRKRLRTIDPNEFVKSRKFIEEAMGSIHLVQDPPSKDKDHDQNNHQISNIVASSIGKTDRGDLSSLGATLDRKSSIESHDSLEDKSVMTVESSDSYDSLGGKLKTEPASDLIHLFTGEGKRHLRKVDFLIDKLIRKCSRVQTSNTAMDTEFDSCIPHNVGPQPGVDLVINQRWPIILKYETLPQCSATSSSTSASSSSSLLTIENSPQNSFLCEASSSSDCAALPLYSSVGPDNRKPQNCHDCSDDGGPSLLLSFDNNSSKTHTDWEIVEINSDDGEFYNYSSSQWQGGHDDTPRPSNITFPRQQNYQSLLKPFETSIPMFGVSSTSDELNQGDLLLREEDDFDSMDCNMPSGSVPSYQANIHYDTKVDDEGEYEDLGVIECGEA